MRFNKVGVLMGGCSSEREISLTSGRAVVEGLREAGYQVAPVILDQESVVFFLLESRFRKRYRMMDELLKKRVERRIN